MTQDEFKKAVEDQKCIVCENYELCEGGVPDAKGPCDGFSAVKDISEVEGRS